MCVHKNSSETTKDFEFTKKPNISTINQNKTIIQLIHSRIGFVPDIVSTC